MLKFSRSARSIRSVVVLGNLQSFQFLRPKMQNSTLTARNADIKLSIWNILRQQGKDIIKREPILKFFIDEAILDHETFADALIFRLAGKLGGKILTKEFLLEIFKETVKISLDESTIDKPDFEQLAMEDMVAAEERDPACKSIAEAFLYFKGFKSIQAYRLAHVLWTNNRKDLALIIQTRCSEVFGVDIHPAARIKSGLLLDHGTGVVIGETSVVGQNCSFLHGITLGGTGKPGYDRHPKLGNNVFVGCQVTILGNITIGDYSSIGAGSLVLKSLPAGATAIGSPATIKSIRDISALSGKNTVDNPGSGIPEDNSSNNGSGSDSTSPAVNSSTNAITQSYVPPRQSTGIVMWNGIWYPKSEFPQE